MTYVQFRQASVLIPIALAAACSQDQPPVGNDDTAIARSEARAGNETVVDEAAFFPGASSKPADGTDPSAPSVDADFRAQENDDGDPKIIGGTRVTGTAFADTVGITKAGSSAINCTGTLIEPDIVLTAAHCACAGINGRVFVGNSVAGGGTFYAVTRKVHGVKTIATPRGRQCVSPMDLATRRDMAILRLARPVTGVTPRGIANNDIVSRAKSFRAVGFGAIDRHATVYPREKREAKIVAVSNDCAGEVGNRPDSDVYGCQANDEIVAGAVRDSTDTCNGDSGGPLLVGPQGTGVAPSTASYRLAGVTSRASSLSQSYCGDGGVYERINDSGREWIRRAIAAVRAQ